MADATTTYLRKLTEEDLLRMRLPKRYWGARPEEVSAVSDREGDQSPREVVTTYIDQIAERRRKGQGLVLYGTNGTGKCIVGSEVVCIDGRLRRLRDVYSGRLAVVPIEKRISCGRGFETQTSHLYYDGFRETLKVVLENGMTLTGTAEHPIATWGRFSDPTVRISELRRGDLVAVDCTPIVSEGDLVRMKIDGVYDGEIDERFAALVGWIMAEGHVHSASTLFTNKNRKARSFVTDAFADLFHLPISYTGKENNGCVTIGFGGKDVSELFEHLGCGGGSGRKFIPHEILSSPRRVLVAFLRALFGGDGSISSGILEYVSKSHDLVRDVQIVLSALGIFSSTASTWKRPSNGSRILREYWRLFVSGQDVVAFRNAIGFPAEEDRKVDRLESECRRLIGNGIDRRVVPIARDDLHTILSSICDALGTHRGHGRAWPGTPKASGGLKGLLGRKFDHLVRSSVSRGVMSISALQKFVEIVDPIIGQTPAMNRLRDLSVGNVRYVPVDSVRESGAQQVWDFVVPSGHLFWSSGMISHNTCMAVVLALAFRRRGHPVLFVEAADLKRLVIEREMFDEEQTFWDRAMNVDVLVLDDLGKGTQDSTGLGARLLDELIRHRNANMLVTIMTTNMNIGQLEKELKLSSMASLKEHALAVHVCGIDRRDAVASEMASAFSAQ